MHKTFIGLIGAGLLSLLPGAEAGGLQRAVLAQLAPAPLIGEVQLLRLDASLKEAMQTGDFVGLAVAVVRDGEVRLLRTYGETEAGSGERIDADTLFRIASLSKGFASSMVGLAVSEGRLSLGAPVSGFAPDLALPRGAERSLTLSDILSHRTGLPPNAYDNLLEAGLSPEDILPQYRKVTPTCPVSDCYAYQNIPYDLAGRALAAAYGAAFSDLIDERLFRPLGMQTATFGLDGLVGSGNWARPHERRRGADPADPWRRVEVKMPYYLTPASGGVNASIRDMAHWLNAQLGNMPEVLPPEVLELVHAPRVGTPTETRRMRSVLPGLSASHYAYGWRVYDYAGQTVVAHGGSVEGYGAQIMFLPQRNTGIVVLSNARSQRLWSLAPLYLDLMLGRVARDGLAPEGARTAAPSQ